MYNKIIKNMKKEQNKQINLKSKEINLDKEKEFSQTQFNNLIKYQIENGIVIVPFIETKTNDEKLPTSIVHSTMYYIKRATDEDLSILRKNLK